MNFNSEINLTNEQSNKTKTIDKLILGFILIFLISLTNSIFINQIGYFGALILMLMRFYLTKENRFTKTGLEIPFAIFLLAELISAILSANQTQAFQNFSKRLLLFPIVYTIAIAAEDIEKAKLFFKFYLGAALITITVYIVFAYEHFIFQLYRLESKGPSPFQYVMTAGGLMSFTVIFLFAFLINEKTKLIIRLFYFLGFGVASLALFASYTRAAWIGAAAGIISIILIKRKWWLFFPILILLAFVILFIKNESRIVKFDLSNKSIREINSIETPGRATSVWADNDTLIVADYEDGIKLLINNNIVQRLETPSPATRIMKWTNNVFISYLVDSRIILFELRGGEMRVMNTFTSPGFTHDFEIKNQYFYVADEDSGLTVFRNPAQLSDQITYKGFEGIYHLDMNDSLLVVYNAKSSHLNFYSLDKFLPAKLTDSVEIHTGIGLLWVIENNVFFQTENKLMHFVYNNNKIEIVSNYDIKGLFKITLDNGNIYAISTNGEFYKCVASKSGFEFKKQFELGFSPTDIYFDVNFLYTAFNKRNRFLSIVDPYHETNIERLNQWKTAIKIVKDHPVFGVGDIDVKDVYAKYKDYYLKENFGHLHNNYIHFLVILGIFGFIAAVYMLIRIFITHLKIYRYTRDVPMISSYALGALSAFVGFLVSGLAEWNFGDHEIITMVWFTLGLNLAFFNNYKSDQKEK